MSDAARNLPAGAFDRLLDGDLSPAEVAAVNAALAADPALRKEFADRALFAAAVADGLRFERATAPASPRRGTVRKLLPWAAVAAAVVVGVVAVTRRADPDATPVAEVVAADGECWRAGPGGEGLCGPGDPVRAGDTVGTTGATAGATLRFPDGTRVALGGDTTVTVSEPGFKLLRVTRGDLSADVTPQPAGRPLRVETPDAVVEVVGTRLAVSSAASGKQTDVGVSHGEVKVTDRARRDTVTVKAGETATVSPAARPVPRVQAEIPDIWEADHSTAWKRGTPVRGAGPTGVEAALVRAEPTPIDGGRRTFHQVLTHSAWAHGLFAVRPGSVVNCEYRLDRPGFVQAFVVTRDSVPDPGYPARVYVKDHFAAGQPAGVWHTARLPVRDFRPTRDGTPFANPVAFAVFFDTQVADLGFTVGRVWVTAE